MVDIRIYVLGKNGKLEPHSRLPLDYYGTCPNVGDTVCFSWQRERLTLYSVQRRYFIDNHDGKQGWAIVIRESDRSTQTDAVIEAWYADDDFTSELDAEDAAEEEKVYQEVLERLELLFGRPPDDIALNKREEGVLQKLASRGVSSRLPCRGISDFGPGTRDALKKRGFITVHAGTSGQFRDEEISINSEGIEVLRKLKAFRKKVEAARAGTK